MRKLDNLPKKTNEPLKNNPYLKSIFDVLDNMDNVSDIQILLTVIASYYVNSEQIQEKDVLQFLIKSCDYFIKDGKIDLSKKEWNNPNFEKIKTHFEVYKQVKKMWLDFENWKKSIKDIVVYIWETLHNTKFRKDIVVHWFWARKNRKWNRFSNPTQDDYLKSNFIFPPHTYIETNLSKLEEKLKDEKLWVYDKAALIWSYVFLTHPFEDGNSRTSRIMMISYLDAKGKRYMKLYTFLSNLVGNIDTYFDFLQKQLYNKYYSTVVEKVKLEWEGNDIKIAEYMDIDEYEKIILKFSQQLKLRLVDISKKIIKNRKYINYLMLILVYISSIKDEDEKKIAVHFLWKMLDKIKKAWFDWIFDDDDIFSISKKFKKRNFLYSEGIDEKIEKVKKTFEDFQTNI